MAELTAREPLLPQESSKPASFFPSLARLGLKSLMWIIFLFWIAAIFFFPTSLVKSLFSKWTNLTDPSVFGITGSIFLVFSGPVLAICLLAFVYIIAFPSDRFEKRSGKLPRFRLWTFPILVDGPFGVVSAAEFIGILLFSVYVLWTITVYLMENQRMISNLSFPSKMKVSLFLEITGLRFGSIGLFCLAFLFLPIARGSILLRLVDIPFEHATRYHVWLGHLTMAIFTLHGLFYVAGWAIQGRLVEKLLDWKNVGVANLPGVISLLAGLLMWVTSLHPVRKNYFELFFYTHQLYVIFVVFLALHVGDFIFSIAAAGIFLFVLDRFLRFCQSRTTVDILSAVCRPCGTVELILSKPPNLRYNALSFIFLQVRELSWLQWHPFSVSSSPMDGRYHLSVLIKVLGEWTDKLRNTITSATEQQVTFDESRINKITASVEGPYGHEVPYHLMYENLILVAGGIGISPFFAIISDICRRINEGKPCLPKNVLVIWAVKKSKELSLLSVLNEQAISSSCSDTLHLDILAYVTQESEPPLEEGIIQENLKTSSLFSIKGKSMSCLVGTGHNIWSGIYFVISTLGFVLLYGLVEKYYIGPFGVDAWWLRGLLFTLCMVASVVVFGGIVVFFWNHWEKSSNAKWTEEDEKKNVVQDQENTSENVNFIRFLSTKYGCRPDFHDLLSSFAKQKENIDVGVIICGPPGLQSSVAKECRTQNIRGRWNQPVFHFHSHSFDL
ncbi:ferric reduction oxidase 7, chloroplastic-like [Canna indica]|uniref:ferric-chelate reductase (NADH) n=1 Tax=Canna indica TaxID=4628 RepID=A0AAQ3K8E9_9LILI|nr:ferric reduction oxidase 7, chloroplastic-like [Canna indica]